jgi:hypothetical protein
MPAGYSKISLIQELATEDGLNIAMLNAAEPTLEKSLDKPSLYM